ncbi:MAG: hypothetical protein AB1657_05950 [Candidatus Micrarchaeota archaeon]
MNTNIKDLSYEERCRNEHFIDNVGADERLSQSFRQEACEFAKQNGIALTDEAHVRRLFAYLRDQGKIERLIKREAGDWVGFSRYGTTGDVERAVSLARHKLYMVKDGLDARMLFDDAWRFFGHPSNDLERPYRLRDRFSRWLDRKLQQMEAAPGGRIRR